MELPITSRSAAGGEAKNSLTLSTAACESRSEFRTESAVRCIRPSRISASGGAAATRTESAAVITARERAEPAAVAPFAALTAFAAAAASFRPECCRTGRVVPTPTPTPTLVRW